MLSGASVLRHWCQMNEMWVYWFGGKTLLGEKEIIYRKACFSVPYLQIRFITKQNFLGYPLIIQFLHNFTQKRLNIEG